MNYIYLDSQAKLVAQNIVGLYPGSTDNSLDLYLFAGFDEGPISTSYQVSLIFKREDGLEIGPVNATYQGSNHSAATPILNPITNELVNVHKFTFKNTKILDIPGHLGITIRYTSSSGTKVVYTAAKVNKASDVAEYQTVAASLANIAQNANAIADIIDGTTVVGEATKASKDADGNNIKTNYAKKHEAMKHGSITFTYDSSTKKITISELDVTAEDTSSKSITLPDVSNSVKGLMTPAMLVLLNSLDHEITYNCIYDIALDLTPSSSSIVISYNTVDSNDVEGEAKTITLSGVDASNAGLMTPTLLAFLNAVRSAVGVSGSDMMSIASRSWMSTIDSVIQAINAITNHLSTHAIDDATTSVTGENNEEYGYDIKFIKKNFNGTSNDLLVTLPLATTSLNGVMSAEDKRRLDALYEIMGEEIDSNALVDKITEVLDIFDSYPEGTRILDALALKVNISDIVDNLTSNISNKPLSAKQGYVLNGLITTLETNKINVSDIVDNLSTDNASKPLSAKQGKWLKDNMITWDDLLAYALEDASYDSDTGVLTITYIDTGNLALSYDGDTGILTFTYGNS